MKCLLVAEEYQMTFLENQKEIDCKLRKVGSGVGTFKSIKEKQTH